MEYLDFSSVITIIRKYINDERTVVDRRCIYWIRSLRRSVMTQTH